MSLYLDKKIVANSRAAADQYKSIVGHREAFRNYEEAHGNMAGAQFNLNARIPNDLYSQFDAKIKALAVGDEVSNNIMSILPSSSIPISKIVAEYARTGDSGRAQTTLSGRRAHQMDSAAYDFDGALVMVHDDSFGRNWREVEGMREADFDMLVTDQANSTRAVLKRSADFAILGDPDALYKGFKAHGMKTSPNTQQLNLGASGLNVNLTTSTSYADFEAAFLAALKVLQGAANNVEMDITFRVSSATWWKMLSRVNTTGDNRETILEAIRKIPGVASIEQASAGHLSGNEFLAWANSDQYIELKTAMAVNTQPIVRAQYNDPFRFLTWSANGILVKADYAGRSGVLYASEAGS